MQQRATNHFSRGVKNKVLPQIMVKEWGVSKRVVCEDPMMERGAGPWLGTPGAGLPGTGKGPPLLPT